MRAGRTLVLACIVGCLAMILAGTAGAEVPRKINYQGRLTDADSGQPIAGPLMITFRIYDVEENGSAAWLAADITTARLMGFELDEVGYLTYCAQAGFGKTDPAAIEVVGNIRPAEVARRFKRHASSHLQRRWESPAVNQHIQEALVTGGQA